MLAIANAGFDNNEGGVLSCERARKLLGKDCLLTDQQLGAIINELMALAAVANDAFFETRKQRSSTASEQPVTSPLLVEPNTAVM